MIQQYIAKTLAGLEGVLAAELEQLGASGVRVLKRAVAFDGDTALLYRANYELRTALRILVPIHSFSAYNEDDYYACIRDIDWSQYMGVRDSLAIDALTFGEVFTHSKFLALLTKDAIVDQFRDRYNRRPDVNVVAPNLRINVHVQGTHCDVSLDASGDSLHLRGYRKDKVEAPLNEVLAAGLIALSGWTPEQTFADPMCGSGTLPIEAALVATQTPIQYHRAGFGFMRWAGFDKKTWESVKKAADARIRPAPCPIIASDIDPRARNSTSLNLMAAGMEQVVQIEKMDFEKKKAEGAPGVLIVNPPYDERLKIEDSVRFYQNMGDALKKNWTDWNAWVISSNRDALKHLGLRPERRITLFNGALECSFQHFALYAGKKVTDPSPTVE